MKKFNFFIAVFTALFALTIIEGCQSSKSAGTAKMLRFDLEKGKAYDYETIMSMDQEIMGQKMQMDMSTYYSMTVDKDENGTKSIGTMLDRFKMKTAVAGFNIDIDTDKPVTASDTSNPMGKGLSMMNKIFGALKGQRMSMEVNSEGKITSISGLEDFAGKIADSLGLDPGQRAEMMKGFQEQFNEDEMRYSFERVWYIFPNKEVKVGDSWQKSTEMKGKMPGRYNSTYKVTEIEADMVTLEEVTKIENISGDKDGMTGEITGTLVVDSRSGLMVSADQDLKFKASAEGMSSEIKAKIKTKGVAR